MKIKVKYFNENCKIEVNKKGDWIDLHSAIDVRVYPPMYTSDIMSHDVMFATKKIPLGIAMELPKGFEAPVISRSSTHKHYGILPTNCFGLIDNSYNGDNDQWSYEALMLRNAEIKEGDRICQFRIQPSQFATPWQKLKWMFVRKIEFVEVEHLGNKNRGGYGTSGKNKEKES